MALKDREQEVARVDEEIEVDLELIGSTAIEDRLQDEVPNTITFAREAGIKVWVLTGDKIETAINIGLSAGLLDTEKVMDLHIIDEIEEEELLEKLLEAGKNIKKNTLKLREQSSKKKQALVIAGASLAVIDANEILKKEFLLVSDGVEVVLACRVSPKQKADIVRLIRSTHPGKTTLAIGDGANDVAMILAAHVGVGILGKEG